MPKATLTRDTLKRLGQQLRGHYEKITEEPLPVAMQDQLARLAMKEKIA